MKPTIIKLYFSIIICLLPGNKNILAQDKTFGYRWVMHQKDWYQKVSTDEIDEQKSLLLNARSNAKGKIGTLIPVFQLDKNGAEITIIIKYKSKNCKKTWLTLSKIGECERIIANDTIILPTKNEWFEINRKVKIKDALLLNVILEAEGSHEKENKLWINKFGVYANGGRLRNEVITLNHNNTLSNDNYRIKTTARKSGNNKENLSSKMHNKELKSESSALEKLPIIKLNNADYSEIPSMDANILGIGETVHGNKTLGNVAFAMIKQRIKENNCKLVLHEFPLESSLFVNRYIKNDPRFKLEDIERYMEGSLSSETTIDFIKWLKHYNTTHNNTVSLWGMDLESMKMAGGIDLSEFVETMFKEQKNAQIDSIVNRLLNGESSVSDQKELTESTGIIGKCLTEDEREIIKWCLLTNQTYKETYDRLVHRDIIMANICYKLIEMLTKTGETTSIYGHFSHLNYLVGGDMSRLDNYAMGHYVRAQYAHNYQAIALCTYAGTTLNALTDKVIGVAKLVDASVGSIEHNLQTMAKGMLYLPTKYLDCTYVVKMRELGNSNNPQQFFYISPKARAEGILFVPYSVAIEKSEDVLKRYLNYVDNTVRRYLEKAKKQKKQ